MGLYCGLEYNYMKREAQFFIKSSCGGQQISTNSERECF